MIKKNRVAIFFFHSEEERYLSWQYSINFQLSLLLFINKRKAMLFLCCPPVSSCNHCNILLLCLNPGIQNTDHYSNANKMM